VEVLTAADIIGEEEEDDNLLDVGKKTFVVVIIGTEAVEKVLRDIDVTVDIAPLTDVAELVGVV
jgi:hypothetical protein